MDAALKRSPSHPFTSKFVSEDGRKNLVVLDQDHPGFRDAAYRARRDEIARIAAEYREGDAVPLAPYTDDEQRVWRDVWDQLGPKLTTYASAQVHEAMAEDLVPRDRIPQFSEVNTVLDEKSGFSLLPVAGLIDGRTFLSYLGRGQFLATQYVRHHSRPLYTPEPDVLHELIGHAMTLVHPHFADLNRLFGRALEGDVSPERVEAILRVYWYTVEFGLVREGDTTKVYGAGLLSSFGEIGRFEHDADVLPLDFDVCAGLPFDPTSYQQTLFVAPDAQTLIPSLQRWIA